jgi:hypothetical protein
MTKKYSNPNFVYYCNDCAKEKGYQLTDNKKPNTCQYCKVTCFANYTDVRLLTIKLPKETGEPFTGDYFNTTAVKDQELKLFKGKANDQTGKILEYFKKVNKEMTPSEVWTNLFDVDNTPITSIRRSMSNLSKGITSPLIKTTKQKTGLYGRPEYIWKLR